MRQVALRNFQCQQPKMGFGCDCVAALICIVAQQISCSEGIMDHLAALGREFESGTGFEVDPFPVSRHVGVASLPYSMDGLTYSVVQYSYIASTRTPCTTMIVPVVMLPKGGVTTRGEKRASTMLPCDCTKPEYTFMLFPDGEVHTRRSHLGPMICRIFRRVGYLEAGPCKDLESFNLMGGRDSGTWPTIWGNASKHEILGCDSPLGWLVGW
jgi:hypothetical protein